MNAIKKTYRLIAAEPRSQSAQTLAGLVRALESDKKVKLADLYELDYDNFNLAIEILKDWRLDRYYMGKAKLHDLQEKQGRRPPEPALPQTAGSYPRSLKRTESIAGRGIDPKVPAAAVSR